ncbi:hypothetical protein FLT43_25835 [Paenibacillus thiaminolyticus]|uniref:Uncharacterized protein n=1 Tax=Paenibacillus thiaminolyticus TaxID=49283 RepID=A0AAP9J2V3_PANTH|nr:hypothetical protein FLT43_25835 [Paenibacillus thiaminolyticus]
MDALRGTGASMDRAYVLYGYYGGGYPGYYPGNYGGGYYPGYYPIRLRPAVQSVDSATDCADGLGAAAVLLIR